MTQCERILEFIEKSPNHSISTYEAFMYLGITRLSARIWDLKKAGHAFQTVPVKGKNRFGEPTDFVRYFKV